MKNFRLKFLLILVFMISGTDFVIADEFPDGWLGRWEGKLLIKTASQSNEIDMTLEIQSISDKTWQWSIIYGTGSSKIEKQYELISVSPEKGTYILDEKNTIVLDMLFRNNTFFSVFSVAPNLVFAEYRMENRKIYFQVISSDINNPNVTGSEGDNSAIVNSYVIHNTQTAVLEKK